MTVFEQKEHRNGQPRPAYTRRYGLWRKKRYLS